MCAVLPFLLVRLRDLEFEHYVHAANRSNIVSYFFKHFGYLVHEISDSSSVRTTTTSAFNSILIQQGLRWYSWE